MTAPTPTTRADLVTAPIQLFIAGAWAETFRAPDDRENIVTYIRADVHEAALAAERALRVAAEARVAVLEGALHEIEALDDNAECCGWLIQNGSDQPECCGKPAYGLDRAQGIASAALDPGK